MFQAARASETESQDPPKRGVNNSVNKREPRLLDERKLKSVAVDPEERYYQRKADHQCTRCGIQLADDYDHQQCPPHLKEARKRSRVAHAERRADRAAKGKCVNCNRPANGLYRCRICYIRAGRLSPTTSVNKRVNIEERTSIDRDGRSRYHGQAKRGAPSAEVIAQQEENDLRSAEELLARYREAMRVWRSPEIQALPRIQRQEAKNAALELLDRAGRFIDGTLDHHKYGTEAQERMEKGHAMKRHGVAK